MQEKCGWKCFGSWDNNKEKLIIRVMHTKQINCSTVYTNKQALLARKQKYS